MKDEAEGICGPHVPTISCGSHILQVFLLSLLFSFLILFLEFEFEFGLCILYRVNGIDFEEIKVDLSKRQQLSPEFRGYSYFLFTLKMLSVVYCVYLNLTFNFIGFSFRG